MSEDTSTSSRPADTPRTGIQPAIDFLTINKVNTLLWMTRLGTMVFSFLSFTSLFGYNTHTFYQRALLCNAASSALRLHQRLPAVQFTTEFGANLIMEDSCHYLLYSLLFIYSHSIQVALVPIFLFAALHSCSFTVALMDKLGSSNRMKQGIFWIVSRHQHSILRFIALTEVFLFPFTIFMMFVKGALLTPFAYYRFLTFRYASRRNPYTRTVFHELRVMLTSFADTPGRPERIRHACHKVINTLSWMAPVIPHH